MKHLLLGFLILAVAPASYGQDNGELHFEEEYATFHTGLSIDEIEENQQEERRLHGERRKIRHRIVSYRKKNEALQSSLEKTRKSLADTKQYYFDEQKIFAKTKSEHDQLIGANRKLEAQLNEAERLAQQQRNVIAELQRNIVRAKSDRERMKDQKDSLKDELIEQRQRLKAMRKEAEALRAGNEKLKKEVSQLREASQKVSHNMSRLGR